MSNPLILPHLSIPFLSSSLSSVATTLCDLLYDLYLALYRLRLATTPTMPKIALVTQQPRWLLLSVFLILWSWSSGFRRDGNRAKALGLGVEARLPPFEGNWEEKRQMGLPACAQRCALQATQDIGCGTSL